MENRQNGRDNDNSYANSRLCSNFPPQRKHHQNNFPEKAVNGLFGDSFLSRAGFRITVFLTVLGLML